MARKSDMYLVIRSLRSYLPTLMSILGVALATLAMVLFALERQAEKRVLEIPVQVCYANQDLEAGKRYSIGGADSPIECAELFYSVTAMDVPTDISLPIAPQPIPVDSQGMTMAVRAIGKGDLVSGNDFVVLPPLRYQDGIAVTLLPREEFAPFQSPFSLFLLSYPLVENNEPVVIFFGYEAARYMVVAGTCYEMKEEGCVFLIQSVELRDGDNKTLALLPAEYVIDSLPLLAQVIGRPVWVTDYPYLEKSNEESQEKPQEEPRRDLPYQTPSPQVPVTSTPVAIPTDVLDTPVFSEITVTPELIISPTPGGR